MSEGTEKSVASGIRAMNKEKGNQSDFAKTGTAPPTLKIDWELYESYLEDSDLSDEQKKEFIETLWNIIVSFVDLGFGLDPTYQALADKNKDDSGTLHVDSGKMKQEKVSEGV